MSEHNREQGRLLFSMMGEFIPGGFFIYRADREEHVTYHNRRLLEIFGCNCESEFVELTGGTFRGMVHPEDYGRIKADIDEQVCTNSDQRDYVEYRIVRRDGSVRKLIDYGMLINDLGDGPVYTVFVEDVTDKI